MACYIPPENSVYGRDSSVQLDQMEHIVVIYSQEYNVLYIRGDFNAQTGTLNDQISQLEYTLSQRQNHGIIINSHGKSLIETLRDTGCCIINGRIGCCHTCNHKGGLSVVDYVITQASGFDNVLDCKIISCGEIAEAVRPFEQIEEEVEMKYPKAMKSKKYNLSEVDNFMNDDHNQRLLNELINEILVSKEQQNDINTLFTKFHSIVIQETTNKLHMNMGRHKRKHKNHTGVKTLNSLWKDMRSKEKCLSNYKVHYTLEKQWRRHIKLHPDCSINHCRMWKDNITNWKSLN